MKEEFVSSQSHIFCLDRRVHYNVPNYDGIYQHPDGTEWSEVTVVRYIFELALNGMSIRKIAKHLTILGIPTRRGRTYWNQSTIQQILTNRAYLGEARSYRYKRGVNYSELRPTEEHIILPDGIIPPLITPFVFEAVQEQFVRNRENSPRNNKWYKETLLRGGYVRCAVCGATLCVKNQKAGRTGNIRVNKYFCQNRMGYEPHFLSIGAKKLDETAWEFAVEHIKNPTLIRERVELLRKEQNLEEVVGQVQNRLEAIRKQISNLVRMGVLAQDDDTIADINGRLHLLEKEKREIHLMLADLTEEEENERKLQESLEKFITWAEGVKKYLDDPEYQPTYEEKRIAVQILGITCQVWPQGYEHRYRLELAPPQVMTSLS